MKILLLGSSQTEHIEPVLRQAGAQVMGFDQNGPALLRRMRNLRTLIQADCVYCVGAVEIAKNLIVNTALLLRKKTIIHWIGTDVLYASQGAEIHAKRLNRRCIHLAVSEGLRQELEEIGIISTVVPIFPPDMKYADIPMPESHAVLSYVPDDRAEFYGLPLVRQLAERFPELPFYIVANDGGADTEKLPNMHYCGLLPKDKLYELYARCSILLRLPRHDGLPVMMLEAQGMGRTVIHPSPFPFVVTPAAYTAEAAADCLRSILSAPPRINSEEIAYIRETYTVSCLLECYKKTGVL